MKTCKTCKWFSEEKKSCIYEEPIFFASVPFLAIEANMSHRCPKLESKLERKCGDCEFFYGGEFCHRYPRQAVVSSTGKFVFCFPETNEDDFCGEFRGKE